MMRIHLYLNLVKGETYDGTERSSINLSGSREIGRRA